MKFFGSDIGFATNLDVVFFFVKITKDTSSKEDTTSSKGKRVKRESKKPLPKGLDGNGLVLSPLVQWTSADLHKWVMGLTFLALDQKKWKDAGHELRDLLCPADECHLIIHENDINHNNEYHGPNNENGGDGNAEVAHVLGEGGEEIEDSSEDDDDDEVVIEDNGGGEVEYYSDGVDGEDESTSDDDSDD